MNAFNLTSDSVDETVNDVTELTTSVGTYQTEVNQQFETAEYSIFVTEIVLYVFYALLILGTLISMGVIWAIYFSMKFNLLSFPYYFWVFNFIVGTIIFIASGFLIAGSLFAFDSCAAYGYYFNNQTNFQKITFSDSDIGSIL